MTQAYLDKLSAGIIGCAIEVHRELGPGLLEKTYEKALLIALQEKGILRRVNGKRNGHWEVRNE